MFSQFLVYMYFDFDPEPWELHIIDGELILKILILKKRV